MDKIFLATVEMGNYLLMAWDTTAELATVALALEYEKEWERTQAGDKVKWGDYADRYGVRVIELVKGRTEWT